VDCGKSRNYDANRPHSGALPCNQAQEVQVILFRCAAVVSGLLMMTGVAFAAGSLSDTDANFAQKAATSGLAEVQAAKLAEQKASSPEVKQFARQMEKDHTAANQELMQIAKGKGIAPPTEPDSAHKAAEQKMAQLSGAQFDQQYMQGQLADHKETVALFQKEASSGQDPQLKGFAQKYLPILQHHLEMAESINAAKPG
jgi:putative membrane protein